METEKERKRGRKVKIKVKKSHHIGTEPLLYVIHDRGLRYRDLWSKAKPRGSTKATQQQHPDDKNKDCHAQTQSNITGAESKIKIDGKKHRFAKSHTIPLKSATFSCCHASLGCLARVARLCIVLIIFTEPTRPNSCRAIVKQQFSTSIVN